MIIKRKWCINIIIFVISILCKNNKSFIKGFNNEGHEAIGMVAMSGLKSDQLYELKKLLNGKDLVDLGKWGHLVHDKIRGAEPMHFNLQNNDCKNISFSCDDKNGLCLINSIKYFYNKLLLPPNSNLNEDIKFKYPRNISFTDSDSLKYLVTLISDMHQPLRISFISDNGGKNINVTFFDNKLQKVKSNLFEYLENKIINKMIQKYQSSWYSGWTHVNRIFNDHKKDEDLFKKNGIDVIYIWAKDIVNDFCSEFYMNNSIESYMTLKEEKLYFDTTTELEISYELEYQLERLIRNNILRAGSRISILLNHIFAKKKFSNFRKRSEFDKVEYEELKKSKAASIYKNNALFINLAIIFVILLAIFYFNVLMNRRNKMRLPNKINEAELQEKCN
ncbi:P1 nuclease, putative [Plasmodium gallinaceum]|uniref:P1 nuclease, putative n=1 Tax=Plasmodium gallinaceum TaxID=5849 RepID=A0A1J1GW13_PLAGA|nr:P1 nuclease, putative [Plasmodium gallinaceum]CRG96627.1 P1 nuclease, putative [Plasmodium gallinaceum]